MASQAEQQTTSNDRRRSINMATITQAANLLREGGLVAFPTETVYGLGANAYDDHAAAGIFAAKGRPQFNPLIIHFPDRASAAKEVVFDERADALAKVFWPGALTLVLPRRSDSRVSSLCSAGLPSLAVRVPSQASALGLLRLCGFPLAAPSANASGRISPTSAEHVWRSLGEAVDLILDDGPVAIGLESTVIALTGDRPRLLRPGGIAREDIEAVIGPLDQAEEGTIEAPGQLASHYAPACPLRMNAKLVEKGEALLAFGEALKGAALTINLSEEADLREAAANLFKALHELDQSNVQAIAAMPVPEQGLGLAINDRLRRAAAPRSSDEVVS